MAGYSSSTQDNITRSETLSVSDALALAKKTLESITIRLVGEVCELNDKPGYKAVYFSVKDEHAVLPCMMWLSRYQANGLRFRVGDVLELTGRFSLYAAKGRMTFDVFSFTPVGEGNLRVKVAQLANKLQAEGLMSPAHKRRIPEFPQVIGLVTSPRGAACHDVFRTLRRRYPLAQVLFAGVPVEGNQAPQHIREGIACVANAGAEVVLVVRGGGSYEDLMPYNDEGLARAIAACPVPVVTGIGHEPDTTIADMVADLRASTPTAAAEAVSPDKADLQNYFATAENRLSGATRRRLERLRHEVDIRASRPFFTRPELLYASEAMALDANLAALQRIGQGLSEKYDRQARVTANLATFERIGKTLTERRGQQIALKAARLQDLSPLNVLSRGYGITYNQEGRAISHVNQVEVGEQVVIALSDGKLQATVTDLEPGSPATVSAAQQTPERNEND